MKIVYMLIIVVLLSACQETDQCKRIEVFDKCLAHATVVNSSTISACGTQSYYLAQRESRLIKDECR